MTNSEDEIHNIREILDHLKDVFTGLDLRINKLENQPNSTNKEHEYLIALVDCANDEKIYDKDSHTCIGRIYPRLYRHRTSGELRLIVTLMYNGNKPSKTEEYVITPTNQTTSQQLPSDFVQIDGDNY